MGIKDLSNDVLSFIFGFVPVFGPEKACLERCSKLFYAIRMHANEYEIAHRKQVQYRIIEINGFINTISRLVCNVKLYKEKEYKDNYIYITGFSPEDDFIPKCNEFLKNVKETKTRLINYRPELYPKVDSKEICTHLKPFSEQVKLLSDKYNNYVDGTSISDFNPITEDVEWISFPSLLERYSKEEVQKIQQDFNQ